MEEKEEALYSFYIDTWVKNFKGQRHSTAMLIAPTYQLL